MKKYTLIFAALLLAFTTFAQEDHIEKTEGKPCPSATLKTLEGENINLKDVLEEGKITIVSFWATWCSPCKKELNAIMDYYEEWQEEYNVELVAVSVDETRSLSKVKPMVETLGWEYRVLLDPTKELQTVANVTSVPFTMVIDGHGNVVYEHTGYNTGDELELEGLLKELSEE